jgi:hypothetical protein
MVRSIASQESKTAATQAAVKEEVRHGTYPRAGGYHRAPLSGAATRLDDSKAA